MLPAAVIEASPTFMPARLSQLAAAPCPAPNQHEASQTKAAAAKRCADRIVSLPSISSTEIPQFALVVESTVRRSTFRINNDRACINNDRA
jgi:hypothetical protein